MNARTAALTVLAAVPLLLGTAVVEEVAANDRGGGRGGASGGRAGGGSRATVERNFDRAGPAASGSFASRPSTGYAGADTRQARPGERTERTDIRQGERTERQGQRQEGMTDRTQDRSDAARDIADDWDGHYYHGGSGSGSGWGYGVAGAVVGGAIGYAAGAAAATPSYVATLPCSPVVVQSGGATYYGCSGYWYNRTYVDGSVTYITVNPPPGY
jgi:hypothetical protein